MKMKKYVQIQEIVEQRLKILEFYYEYGLQPTLDAYQTVGKSTLYDWKKAYEESGKRRESLIPQSTRPNNYRQKEM